jgi:hypothetical protein
MKSKKAASKKHRSRNQRLLLSVKPRRDPKKAAIKAKVRQNRPLHRKIVLHPASVMVILAAAVFIFSWTISVIADEINVTAKVPAPPLQTGAVIISPYNNAVIHDKPIDVSGTCPDSSYVKLLDNSTFSGVAWCINNTFTITTDLYTGQNALQAQDYNITDDPGPITPAIDITYIPPLTAVSSGNSTGSAKTYTSQPGAKPVNVPNLFIGSNFHYQTVLYGHTFSWSLDINGGLPPYSVTINWGDGQTTKMSISTDPEFSISHVFKKPGYYAVIVNVMDSGSQSSLIQLAALVRSEGSVGVFSLINPSGPPSAPQPTLLEALRNTPSWLKLAWPSLLIVLLMLISFWLGEREQILAAYRKRAKAH